jgi:hypothetical protein
VAKKPIRSTGRGSDQFLIRFPEGMRDRIAKLAAANGRSMNAELIVRLEQSLSVSGELKELGEAFAELMLKVDGHEAELGQVKSKLGL